MIHGHLELQFLSTTELGTSVKFPTTNIHTDLLCLFTLIVASLGIVVTALPPSCCQSISSLVPPCHDPYSPLSRLLPHFVATSIQLTLFDLSHLRVAFNQRSQLLPATFSFVPELAAQTIQFFSSSHQHHQSTPQPLLPTPRLFTSVTQRRYLYTHSPATSEHTTQRSVCPPHLNDSLTTTRAPTSPHPTPIRPLSLLLNSPQSI
jgi:hypothetical protein